MERIDLDSKNASIYLRMTKNREPKRIQLPDIAVDAIWALPSYGHDEYVFPAKANPRFGGNFKKPHVWDLGKRFRRVAEAAGIQQLRIGFNPYLGRRSGQYHQPANGAQEPGTATVPAPPGRSHARNGRSDRQHA